MLDPQKTFAQVIELRGPAFAATRGNLRPGQTDKTVELVERAKSVNTGGVLRDARSANKPRLSLVTRARVNTIDAYHSQRPVDG